MIVGLSIEATGVVSAVRPAAGAPPETVSGGDLTTVFRSPATRCVVAVPDRWLDGSADGVRQADHWRRILLEAGAGDPRFVARSVACAGERDAVVHDLSGHSVTVSVLRDGVLTDSVTEIPPGDGDVLTRLAATVPGPAGARRAELVLARAATTARYRQTPLYHGLTAGEILDAWAPVDAAIRRCQKALTGTDRLPVVRIGALAHIPAGPSPATGTSPVAATEGALRLAETDGSTRSGYPYLLTLPVHRVHRGELCSQRLTIAEPGDPAPSWTRRATPPIEVPPGAPGRFTVEHSAGAEPTVLTLPDVPPGTYRVRVWPAFRGPGVLGWFPADGGAPHLTELPT
ncbi:hypothetical protein [Actinoplanes sp. NPDC026670]|uniref:hypothetical protein n=1 Tax=Actinoplanes sp. NPDC026670 TaxID=3154700 RepID=UPI0033D1892A